MLGGKREGGWDAYSLTPTTAEGKKDKFRSITVTVSVKLHGKESADQTNKSEKEEQQQEQISTLDGRMFCSEKKKKQTVDSTPKDRRKDRHRPTDRQTDRQIGR